MLFSKSTLVTVKKKGLPSGLLFQSVSNPIAGTALTITDSLSNTSIEKSEPLKISICSLIQTSSYKQNLITEGAISI